MNNRVEAVAVKDAAPFFKIERAKEVDAAGGVAADIDAVAPYQAVCLKSAIRDWGRKRLERRRGKMSATLVGRMGDGRYVFALEGRRIGQRRAPVRLVAVPGSDAEPAAITRMFDGRLGSTSTRIPEGDPLVR
ncbi:hypothetical protein [Sphingomonas sp. RIT328]|uniref:hypothetical protein n=1 Tax=Sphingomonas sp. RIT328 TaxID=1470591 RepID=UPI00055BC30E|nr:hypothetical protein [Sphingomonas sp. RIT328]